MASASAQHGRGTMWLSFINAKRFIDKLSENYLSAVVILHYFRHGTSLRGKRILKYV